MGLLVTSSRTAQYDDNSAHSIQGQSVLSQGEGDVTYNVTDLDALDTAADIADESLGVASDALDFGSDALAGMEGVASDALDFGSDALAGMEGVAGDALDFGSDALAGMEGVAGDALDFGIYTIESNAGLAETAIQSIADTGTALFDFMRGTLAGVVDNSVNAQARVLDAAGMAITAADETSDERTSKTAMYAVAGVAAAMVLAVVMVRR